MPFLVSAVRRHAWHEGHGLGNQRSRCRRGKNFDHAISYALVVTRTKAFCGLRAVELISEIEVIQRLQTSNYFALAEIC